MFLYKTKYKWDNQVQKAVQSLEEEEGEEDV
jgi:hypothetical protein